MRMKKTLEIRKRLNSLKNRQDKSLEDEIQISTLEWVLS
jgi:hypothetical protein